MTTQKTKPRREDVKDLDTLCEYCSGKCCRYFAMEIDEPIDWEDFDRLRCSSCTNIRLFSRKTTTGFCWCRRNAGNWTKIIGAPITRTGRTSAASTRRPGASTKTTGFTTAISKRRNKSRSTPRQFLVRGKGTIFEQKGEMGKI